MKEINIKELNINPCLTIGKNWMLISAGNKDKSNCMTASWGSIGSLWGRGLENCSTITIYVRPSRYTDSFIDKEEYFTICFFPNEYHQDLLYLGTHSGRNEDKLSHTKLTLDYIDNLPIYKEANLVIICKKIYKDKFKEENFIDNSIIKDDYPDKSYHNVYIGEIKKIFVK